MKDTVRDVILHYLQMATRQPQYTPTRLAELAPGVVAVEDRSGECDVLFDKTQWQYTTPDIWGESNSEILRRRGLAVLPGTGRYPPISTITDMVKFAHDQLSPMEHAEWHTAPMYVRL